MRRRLPLRLRLTLMFAAGMAVVLGAVGVFVYVRTGSDLLAVTDAGLRSRAEVLAADVRAHGPELAHIEPTLIERDEAFAQFADASGQITESSTVVRTTPLLLPDTIRSLTGTALFDRRIPTIDNVTRVLATPVSAGGTRVVVMVGASLQDRRDQMLQLAATLAIGEPIALALISFAGWLLAGAALHPVERMRREATEISTSDPARRLPVPQGDDEVARLGATLNAMLDRIQESFVRERRFVDNASHELRTPLAILKTELDLALSRARSVEELEAALRSATSETDHLTRLAEDLLVLSRAHEGRLPVHRVDTSLVELLGNAREHWFPRAKNAGVRIEVDAPSTSAAVDPVRVRQAVDNLLDNALRHSPAGGVILVSARCDDGEIRLTVEDAGPGFAAGDLDRAFEPFARGPGADKDGDGAGLGLAIVRAVAEAHGGSATASNRAEGGARVTVVLRD